MGDKTRISWTDATWNPTTGCTKVSAGCKNCYAKREWARLSANPETVYFGREFEQVRTHPERTGIPRRWRRPRRIFVDSMSDLFHEQVPDHFIYDVFASMQLAGHHRFQVLTKRAERMFKLVTQIREDMSAFSDWSHIELGVSAEDQFTFEERAQWLLRLQWPVRFLSLEPLLGMIDMRGRTERRSADTQVISVPPVIEWPLSEFQWIVTGGESGPGARPVHPKHVLWIRDQCALAGVPFHFKQWGEWVPTSAGAFTEAIQSKINSAEPRRVPTYEWPDGTKAFRVGKKTAGRYLDGRTHDETGAASNQPSTARLGTAGRLSTPEKQG